ncbi:uncharacterized protein PF11_0213-like isoform X2 [Maniola jurtina]|uniref:uncharacterized protein PF11_0213-like isoform X2 n=1 Tax=Maniola jurtina TaxID=191418 RepID=UPI001E68BBB4|nr:uncharacterized protein PF11_0213-like isoform X2 [Maniola jurtina]
MAKTKQTFGEYKCKICSKVFSERGGLNHHLQLHTSDKPFSCNKCTFTCKTKKYLHRHANRVHTKREKDNECDVCGKKFLFKSLLDRHVYIHSDVRPFKCEVCNKGFNSRYSLSSHRHTHTGAKPYKCDYCDYACRDNSTLRKHKERHTGITRLYQCTACDKSYKTKSVLKMHIAEVHMAVDIKTMPCSECGKMFKCLKTLNNHVRLSHLKLYKCKCEICGITLSNKYNMRSHLTSHIDYRPFKCSFEGCDKRFKDKCGLKKHTIIHYPEKHFECSICKKKFSRYHRMIEHKKQHKAKKKCVFCDYCGKGFYSKSYIYSHITKKHMYRKQYMCDLCDFSTYNKPSLVMHIKHGHVSEMDRKCKICKKTYKKHIYLKLHYWNTHSIKYKLNRVNLKKPKKKKINNIIIEENSETGLKEIELLHEIKVEQMSDTEEMKDGTQYSMGVLSEDINRAISEKNGVTPDTFKDLFIEHIIMPSSSNGEETQRKETDIYVDVTCQKEAERVRAEMLERWKPNAGVKPFIRLKRHYDGTIKNNSKTIKNEKIEVTVFSENESNVPIREEVSRRIEVNRKNTKKSRFVNYCDKISEILEKFNNENLREDEKISKINHKISKIGEQIQNNIEKDSVHHKKQIIKKLNRALAKYNNLVKKVSDIHNKEPESSPENVDTTNDVLHRGDNGLTSIGDEHRQNNENNGEVTSTNIHYVIKRNDEREQASIGDENKQNSEYNCEKASLENDANKSGDMTTEVIKKDECKKLSDELTSSENANRIDTMMEKIDDDFASISDENRQNNEYNCENRSSDVQKCDDDCTSIGDEHNIEYNGALTECGENRNYDMFETGDDDLTSIEEHIHNEYNNEITSSVNDENSGDVTQISVQASTGGDDFKQLNAEMELENDEIIVCIVMAKGNDLSSIDDDRHNSDGGINLLNKVENFDKQALIGHENTTYSDVYNELNDKLQSSENDTSIFDYVIEKSEEVSIGDEEIRLSQNGERSCNVTKTCDNQVLMGDESILNSNDFKKLECEISFKSNESGELIKIGDNHATLGDENSQIDACTGNDENITVDNLVSEQVNIENIIGEVNQLNSSENGILYENSLAELVKLRKRKCVKNVTSISYIDGTDNEELVYINNIKDIDGIIKEIDNMIALIENRNPETLNNSEKLKSVKRNRKPRKKRCKRNIKEKVNTKSGINKIPKIKVEKIINNDELEKRNDEIVPTDGEKIPSTENDETFNNNQSDFQEISIENYLEEGDNNKYWIRRSIRNRNKKNYTDFVSHNDFDSDNDRDQDFVPNGDDEDESGDEMKNKSDKFKLNTHQCYVCFKLYQTKEKLIDHCKEHFDICNPKMLKKCPFCEYVTNLDLVKHVRLIHKVNLNYLYGTLKDRKNNNCNKSRFYFNVENNLVDEVEVIPSIPNLNRQAYLKIDRRRREKNDKEVKKAKLVKKDTGWIVEKVLINTKKENYVLPDKVEELLKNKEKASKNDENDKSGENNSEKEPESDEDARNDDEEDPENDKDVENNEEQLEKDKIDNKNDGTESNSDDYCAKLQRLYRIAKTNGQKMLFPCNQCEKICQTLSALKLHSRRHDPNAKPFKKKVWKHKLSEDELKKLQESKEKSKKITKNIKNRYEKPKPIVNKHKCDPKLKDFYEKNIKGGDIEFWQFLKIFNKMSRENVNDFSDLENRTEFGIHFIDPKLNPSKEVNSSTCQDFNSKKLGSSNSKTKKSKSKTLGDEMGTPINKMRKDNKFKRTILISEKEFLRRNAIKDILRKKNIRKCNTNT